MEGSVNHPQAHKRNLWEKTKKSEFNYIILIIIKSQELWDLIFATEPSWRAGQGGGGVGTGTGGLARRHLICVHWQEVEDHLFLPIRAIGMRQDRINGHEERKSNLALVIGEM